MGLSIFIPYPSSTSNMMTTVSLPFCPKPHRPLPKGLRNSHCQSALQLLHVTTQPLWGALSCLPLAQSFLCLPD